MSARTTLEAYLREQLAERPVGIVLVANRLLNEALVEARREGAESERADWLARQTPEVDPFAPGQPPVTTFGPTPEEADEAARIPRRRGRR